MLPASLHNATKLMEEENSDTTAISWMVLMAFY